MSVIDQTGVWEYRIVDGGAEIVRRVEKPAGALTIPDELDGFSVVGIGENAFFPYSALTSISIPKSVVRIEKNPFTHCPLRLFSVSSANPAYAQIDGVLFHKAEKSLVAYPSARMGEYEIPEGIASIGVMAFHDCSSLTSLTLPLSVNSIGEGAFNGCPNLTLTVSEGSYAETYAIQNTIPYAYAEADTSWLTD